MRSQWKRMSLLSASAPVHPTLPEAAEPPPHARFLASLGLLPFGLGAVLVWLVHPELQSAVALALAAYAAMTVAFLGGIHWGLAMRADTPGPRSFGWSCVPVVVAWLGVVMPAMAGLALEGAMLIVCYAVDRRLYPAGGMAHWLTLRFRLSMIAALCCFLGAAGA
jgi:hypothetical protein